MKPAPFDYARASDAAEAVALLAEAGEGAKLLAGGQSLGPMLNLRLARPTLLVDIRRAADLLAIDATDDAVRYGAGTPHAAFEDACVPDATPGWLSAIARGIAYRAVRNRGTVGGSLAHADPGADWPSALLALGATVEILGLGGARRAPLAAIQTGPFAVDLAAGEVLTGVSLPRRSAGARWGYWKFCRKTGEFAKAIGAVLHDPDRGETRAVIGAIEDAPVLIEGAAADALFDDPRAAEELVARHAPALSPAGQRLHAEALARAARIAAAPREAAA